MKKSKIPEDIDIRKMRETMTLREIAEIYDVCPERVRQRLQRYQEEDKIRDSILYNAICCAHGKECIQSKRLWNALRRKGYITIQSLKDVQYIEGFGKKQMEIVRKVASFATVSIDTCN